MAGKCAQKDRANLGRDTHYYNIIIKLVHFTLASTIKSFYGISSAFAVQEKKISSKQSTLKTLPSFFHFAIRNYSWRDIIVPALQLLAAIPYIHRNAHINGDSLFIALENGTRFDHSFFRYMEFSTLHIY